MRMTPLSAQIRQRRIALGMSQADLALRISRSQSRIAEIESGTKNPTVEILLDVMTALKMTMLAVPDENLPAVRSFLSMVNPALGSTNFMKGPSDDLLIPDPTEEEEETPNGP